MEEVNTTNPSTEADASCDPRLSRKEFLKKLIGPAIIVGAIYAPPKVVDRFVLQPAQASMSNLQSSRRPSGPGWNNYAIYHAGSNDRI